MLAAVLAIDLEVPARIDLARTMIFQRFGPWDPCARYDARGFVKAFRVRGAPLVVRVSGGGAQVRVELFGDGAESLIASVGDWVGAADLAWSPDAALPVRVRGGIAGTRLIRVPWITDLLTAAILQQRVRYVDAARSWRALALRTGTEAPGFPGLIMPPSFRDLARIADDTLLFAGIDLQRRRTLRAAWSVAHRVDALADVSREVVCQKLASIPGVGPWTVATVSGIGLADPDAVPLGDYVLPSTVAFALAGEERADDARMLSLLAPFAGNRFRVVRAIWAAGIEAPRRGPRRPAPMLR